MSADEARSTTLRAAQLGVNIVDCWMSDPEVRRRLGDACAANPGHWIVQGHIGSTWQNGQYVRTRDVEACKVAFDDLLTRFHTDHVELGMMHYIDDLGELKRCLEGPYRDFVEQLKAEGVIRHIGMSTHSAVCGSYAVEQGAVEMMLFSINPAYDMQPGDYDIETLTSAADAEFSGFDADRLAFYRACERADVGLTVMKAFAGGRLLDATSSPFGVAMTPAMCIHYALTRPAVASVMCGFGSVADLETDAAYCDSSEEERDYASVLATAPRNNASDLCTYCGHCAPCPVGISVAQVNKFYDLAEAQISKGGAVPPLVRDHYLALDHHADECVGCGGCESRCPFGMGVIDRMAKAAELFA
jgi:predicted aldo/keto reductase-like oxidoreductase